MNEIQILTARLGWPSTTARWWCMQELAAWLGKPDSSAETESALLQLLSSRKLEAEVVEILCIFFMAAQGHDYSPTPRLAENIPKSSILSELLLENLGLPTEAHDDGLEEVPEEFEIPPDFDGIQGSDLPRIFLTSMSGLERVSGLPFVRQMAFEWSANQAAYPDVPFGGDPWHFSRPLGDDFVGQLSSRTALRAISAYLRTLAVAEKYWGMPTPRAQIESLMALPIHPTMAFLRPSRPLWFPGKTDFDGDSERIESALRALVSSVQAERLGNELIAFSSPIDMSNERCVEVSVVRWSQSASSNITDANLAEHLKDFWTNGPRLHEKAQEPLSSTTFLSPFSIDGILDRECNAWPLAIPLGYDRLGYLQHDLYPFRIFLPAIPGSNQVEVIPRDGQLQIEVDRQVVADLCYWNAGWGAARPMQLGGNCGTALISHGTGYHEWPFSRSTTIRSFYLWQVRTLHRSNSYDRSFSQTLVRGATFV